MFVLIAGGDKDGRAVWFQKRRDFVIGQRPAQCGGAIFDFGLEIGGEFGGDVFAMLFRKPEFYGSEVTVEELHGSFVR